MQRPVHPSYGRVKQNVDGCLFVWTGKHVSRSPVHSVHRTARSALHGHVIVIGIVYFMSINVTFAVAARTRKVSRRLKVYKPLLAVLGVS